MGSFSWIAALALAMNDRWNERVQLDWGAYDRRIELATA
jgi:hypothetical protein